MIPTHFIVSVGLLLAAAGTPATGLDTGAVRALIAASASARLGGQARVDVEILQPPAAGADVVAATPLPGARIGAPARFVLTFADGRRGTAVARVRADAGHVVASRSLGRDAELGAGDVAWIDGPLDGQLIEPLPTLEDVVGARTRRAIARGEVVTAAVVRPADAVRAGDPVTLVIRRGPIEVRGAGRAISSGSTGDTIRVLRPGSREPLRARIVEPAVVEILK